MQNKKQTNKKKCDRKPKWMIKFGVQDWELPVYLWNQISNMRKQLCHLKSAKLKIKNLWQIHTLYIYLSLIFSTVKIMGLHTIGS